MSKKILKEKILIKITLFSFAVIFIFISGFLDIITGQELSLYLLYIFPLFYINWNFTRYYGLSIAMLSAVVWMLVDIKFGLHKNQIGFLLYDFIIRSSFFSLLSILINNNKMMLEKEKKLSRTDKKTGAYNDRALYEILENELERLKRNTFNMCIVYFDLDNFKNANDTYGHQAGDEILVLFSLSVKNCIRTIDKFFRLGGDEFILLLPYSKISDSKKIIERIKKEFYKKVKKYSITISTGIVEIKKHHTYKELIQAADEEMYKSKKKGSDLVSSKVLK